MMPLGRLPFVKCSVCVEYIRYLSGEHGEALPRAVTKVADRHGIVGTSCLAVYMSLFHELFHELGGPTDKDASSRLPPEPHPYSPPARIGILQPNFCAHGALISSGAFCGRPRLDEVHTETKDD